MKRLYVAPNTETTKVDKLVILAGSGTNSDPAGNFNFNGHAGSNTGDDDRPNAKGNTFDVWDDGDEDEE